MEDKKQYSGFQSDMSDNIIPDLPKTNQPSFSSKGLDQAILKRLQEVFGRAKNRNKLPKGIREKQERERKRKRLEANKSRKTNQAKARLNKFQRKKS